MFWLILVISFIHLFAYNYIGKGFKKILKINFKGMDLLIGYAFALLLFYIFNIYFIINNDISIIEKVFPLYVISLIPFIYKGIKTNKSNFDFIIIGIIALYIIHFFTLTFIVPEEAKEYLTRINRNLNLSVFQSFTLLKATFFRIHPTVYTVNVMTIINLFIILYTIYECLQIFFIKTKTKRLSFLLFLLLFTVVNSPNENVLIGQNAYHFLYHPFTGDALYLYAMIPFQFILLYRLNEDNDLLVLLMNLSCMAFSSISILMQIILNIGYIIILILRKNKNYLYRYIIISLYPMLIHLLIFNYSFYLILLFIIIVTATILLSSIVKYNHKYKESNLSLYGVIILVTIYTFIILTNFNMDFWPPIVNYQYSDKENNIIILYYGLVLYSLLKLYKDKGKIKQIFFNLQLIILFLIINPLTLFFVFKNNIAIANLLFLLPTTFTIIYVFFKNTKIIEKTLIILLIVSISQTIYYPLQPINQTKQNVYYRLNKEVVNISQYLNQYEDINNIIVSENLLSEMVINTNINILSDENNDILYVNLMINDIIPFDLFHFIETIDTYDISVIIIDKDKMVNTYLEILSNKEENFDYYIIYFFKGE